MTLSPPERGSHIPLPQEGQMVEHPAARGLTGYLLVGGGVHQIAYARAIEKLTGADLTKMFPTPRIPTDKIPECRPHIERGDHLRLYRFSPEDYQELPAVFNGPSPETGEDLVVFEQAPEASRRAISRPSRRSSLRIKPGGDLGDRGEAAPERQVAEGADRPCHRSPEGDQRSTKKATSRSKAGARSK